MSPGISIAMIHKLPLPSDLPAVTIVGAGKLGKAVAAVWEERGGSIAKLVTSGQTWEPKDLVFEATQPEAAAENLARCIRARIPVVTGTTGWLDQLPEMLDMSQKERSTVFYSTNFSPRDSCLERHCQACRGHLWSNPRVPTPHPGGASRGKKRCPEWHRSHLSTTYKATWMESRHGH